MSIHVTVSSNPVCISRSKILLADLEQAKKNEWNRRRIIRLQQVRQQSRDLANNLRTKCNTEIKKKQQQECEENEEELKQWQAEKLKRLQEAYEKGLAAVGTAHRSAYSEVENDENIKEKQELRDALAKARGELARERAKFVSSQVKPASVPVKCISNKGNARGVASTSQGLNRNKNNNSPSKSTLKQKSANEYTKKIEINKCLPTECTISSPGHNIKIKYKPKTIRSVPPKPIIRQHSCSPSRSSVKVKDVSIDSSDDSDDSNLTWPPRSTRTSKINYSPIKVRLYNHDQRISKDYVKPGKSVTHIDSQENEEMEKYIEEEEESVFKKSELDAAIKKRSDTRGQQALKKERLEREFKTLENQYSQVEKQQRIARIFEFPYPFKESKERRINRENESKNKLSNAIPSTSKESDDCFSIAGKNAMDSSEKAKKPTPRKIAQDLNECFEVAALQKMKADKTLNRSLDASFSSNPFTMKKLIQDLEKERDLLMNSSIEKSPLKDSNRNVTNKDSSCRKSVVRENVIRKVKHDENCDVNADEERRLSGAARSRTQEKPPHPIEVNVITKPLCECCDGCCCSNKQVPSTKPRKRDNETLDQNGNKDKSFIVLEQSDSSLIQESNDKSQEASKIFKNRNSVPCGVQVNRNNSSDTEMVSTSSSNDIKITVKVKEKSKGKLKSDQDVQPLEEVENIKTELPWSNRLSGPFDTMYSGSSYCSPPDKLSPAQESILNTILLKMCLKNKNPQLHKYIKRLLSMNKSRVDNLIVSSPSDVSIHSDVFNNTTMDNITGTCQLKEPSTSTNQQVKIAGSKENSKNTASVKKKIILNSSVEDSPVQETAKSNESETATLADQYSLRLKELVHMLNQVSPKVVRGSEFNGNYDSSSYLSPPVQRSPLSVRFSSNGPTSNIVSSFENGNSVGNVENASNNYQSENQKSSAFLRNDITSLGLPFELLPKPFTLEVDNEESLPKPKPPVSSYKYRVEGHLPHELSAIPEVSSQICSRNQGQPTVNEEIDFSDLNEEYLSDIDLLDVSSIKDTSPMKILNQQTNTGTMQCIHLDSSSLSILSHRTNESIIDMRSETNSNLDTSSSDYIEEVFRSLGVGWALSTLKKIREARLKDSSTSSSPSNNSFAMIERKRSKSNSRTKVNRSHSTPKKLIESQQSASISADEDIQKQFEALKSDRLSLTPPDLTLKIPNLVNH